MRFRESLPGHLPSQPDLLALISSARGDRLTEGWLVSAVGCASAWASFDVRFCPGGDCMMVARYELPGSQPNNRPVGTRGFHEARLRRYIPAIRLPLLFHLTETGLMEKSPIFGLTICTYEEWASLIESIKVPALKTMCLAFAKLLSTQVGKP